MWTEQDQAVLAWLQSEDRMPLDAAKTRLKTRDFARLAVDADADIVVSLNLVLADVQPRIEGVWDRRTKTYIVRGSGHTLGETPPGVQIAGWAKVLGEICCAADRKVAQAMRAYSEAGPNSAECTRAAKRAFLSRKPEPDVRYISDARELDISFGDMALSRNDMSAVAARYAQEFIRIDELNQNRCRELRALQVRAAQIAADAEADPEHPWHALRSITKKRRKAPEFIHGDIRR